jgi:fructose-bisphosphate aldolase, class I
VLGAILFENTMDGQAKGMPVPAFLRERGVVPFLKVDNGLEAEKGGVSLMKPMPELDVLLARAVTLGIFGTKMRSTINLPSQEGVAAVVKQQFKVAAQIASHGLMPIIEPEVLIKSPDKAGAEAMLRAEILKQLDAMPDDRQRWSRLIGQFGGWDKLGSGCRQAANLSISTVPYASSGVHPARAE